MDNKQKSQRTTFNPCDRHKRTLAQNLAFSRALEAMEETRKAEIAIEEAQLIRNYTNYEQ